MNILYFYLFLLVHPYLAMWWKSFEQADRKPWEALIPGYNYFIAFKLGCQKPFWALLLAFPGVHLVMWSVVNTSYIRRFGYYSLIDTIQGIFFPYIIMAKIAQSGDKILPETNWANSKEIGDREWGDHLALFLSLPVLGHIIALGFAAVTRAKPGKKTKVKEWGDSILFALVAASIIRTYVFEPFQIPTGSMEKTLVVGDFLFVNKLSYGPKVPVTPLSYPLVHNTVPLVNIKSYTGLETCDYTRLPGFGKVERNDVVVFNYPSGDTAVYDPRMPHGLMGHDYHEIVIKEAFKLYEASSDTKRKYGQWTQNLTSSNNKLPEDKRLSVEELNQKLNNQYYKEFIENLGTWKAEARIYLGEQKKAHTQTYEGEVVIDHYGLIPRPVDKRENYIKRCVGLPGDWIEIDSSILYVNGKPAFIAENQNLMYFTYNWIPDVKFMKEIGMESERDDYVKYLDYDGNECYRMHFTRLQLEQFKTKFPTVKIILANKKQYSDNPDYKPTYADYFENLKMYPKDPYINNTVSNFTKFQLPSKGQTINIDKDNIAWYRRAITAYEGHSLAEKADGIYIDGKKTDKYTFAMNYYWMMGDNRYNSTDSRMWGFVPEDHIVGKASMVWFSKSPYAGIRWERLFTIIE